MYAIILAGHVSLENWDRLEQLFSTAVRHPPEGLVQAFLMHSRDEPHNWHLVSVWHSHEDYEKARQHSLIKGFPQLFCESGSVPDHSAHHIVRHYLRMTEQ